MKALVVGSTPLLISYLGPSYIQTYEHVCLAQKPRREGETGSLGYFGFTDIVRLLLDEGMSIQVKGGNPQTSRHYAVKFDEKNKIWNGNITTVNFLL